MVNHCNVRIDVDIKERTAKSKLIERGIVLTGTMPRECDVETLYDFVASIQCLLGEARADREPHTSFSSDGKFIRIESDTYTICQDNGGVFVGHRYEYHDDDGSSGTYDERISDGRSIINLLISVFK